MSTAATVSTSSSAKNSRSSTNTLLATLLAFSFVGGIIWGLWAIWPSKVEQALGDAYYELDEHSVTCEEPRNGHRKCEVTYPDSMELPNQVVQIKATSFPASFSLAPRERGARVRTNLNPEALSSAEAYDLLVIEAHAAIAQASKQLGASAHEAGVQRRLDFHKKKANSESYKVRPHWAR